MSKKINLGRIVGESAYEIALRLGKCSGSEADFIDGLRGPKGDKGDSGTGSNVDLSNYVLKSEYNSLLSRVSALETKVQQLQAGQNSGGGQVNPPVQSTPKVIYGSLQTGKTLTTSDISGFTTTDYTVGKQITLPSGYRRYVLMPSEYDSKYDTGDYYGFDITSDKGKFEMFADFMQSGRKETLTVGGVQYTVYGEDSNDTIGNKTNAKFNLK